MAEQLYRRALGADWESVPEAMRRAHLNDDEERLRLSGRFVTTAGVSLVARMWQMAARLPRRGGEAPAFLEVVRRGVVEEWRREIGDWRLTTVQSASREGEICEAIGPGSFHFDVSYDDGHLRYVQRRLRFSAFGVEMTVPRWAALQVSGHEWVEDGSDSIHVETRITSPGGRSVLTYEGVVRREE